MRLRRKKTIWGIGLGLAFVIGMLALLVFRPKGTEASPGEGRGSDDEPTTGDSVVDVDTIRPQRNLAVYMEVKAPADVEAFYRADMASLVAGVVKSVSKSIGDRVRRNEVLVEVDVPDRVQDVFEKESIVQQRVRELKMAEERTKVRKAAVEAAWKNKKGKDAQVVVADAEKAWRLDDWRRYIDLANQKAITRDLVVERKKYYLVAEAGAISARVDVEKAIADWEEEKAKLKEAEADEILKDSLIEVAHREQLRAQAVLDYAKITAPFDGVIIRRDVDPGDFVQNAATGQSKALLAVVRSDIVTVVMKVPDTFARFVNKDTSAMIRLRGRLIKAKVTRFSPSIHAKDRTQRVEVDLYNGKPQQYRKYLSKGLSKFLTPVGIPSPLQATNLLAAARSTWGDNMKASMDPFPAYRETLKGIMDHSPAFLQNQEDGSASQSRELLPGMYGQMTLLLKNFPNSYLIPTRALFSVGGKKFIMVVKDGTAHRVPVDVQASDAKLAKVQKLVRRPTDIGVEEEPQELTGKEEIILPGKDGGASGQTEINDGQAVRARLVDWPARDKAAGGNHR
jgi:multidrug efflux pump subunit AcrA (membrane-fusion protein)